MHETLDRSQQEELLTLSERLLKKNLPSQAAIALSEAARIKPLTETATKQLTTLSKQLEADTDFQNYRKRTGKSDNNTQKHTSRQPLRILIVTNLFPPQEYGGYGRTLWEFCSELRKRGHTIHVLTSNVPSLSTPPALDLEHFEHLVSRSLYPLGNWDMLPPKFNTNHHERIQFAAVNHERVMQTVHRFKPDVCLVGNLDLIDYSWIEPVIKMRIPCIYRLGNSIPSFGRTWMPHTPLFALAPCSKWLKTHLETSGYDSPMHRVLYPGAMTEHYYMHYPPSYDKLRIVFASHISAIKGADVLLNALVYLNKEGIPFEADFAGKFSDTEMAATLHRVINTNGLEDQIRLHGYVDSQKLKLLYARANVLVFPSSFDEPFGKSAIEGMAAGLILVSSATGGQAELLEDEVTGLAFERMNHVALKDTLASLPKDPERWKRIALAGRERALNFSTAASVDTIESIFDEQFTLIESIPPTDSFYFSPKRKAIHNQLHEALEVEAKGEHSRARILLEECVQQDTELPESLWCRGAFLTRRNQWQSANVDFLNALTLTPNCWEANFGQAKCFAAQNNWGPAARTFSETAQWATQQPIIFNELARCMAHLKQTVQQGAAEHRAQALIASGIPEEDPLSLDYSRRKFNITLSEHTQ